MPKAKTQNKSQVNTQQIKAGLMLSMANKLMKDAKQLQIKAGQTLASANKKK